MQLPRHGGEGGLLILLSIFSSSSSLQFNLLQQNHISISSSHSIFSSNFQPCSSSSSTSAANTSKVKVTWGKVGLRFFYSLAIFHLSFIHHYCPFFISYPFHHNKSSQYSNKEDHKHEQKSILVHAIKNSNYSAYPSYITSIHKYCHLNVSIRGWSHLSHLIKEPYISIGLTRIRVCIHSPSPSPFLSFISLPSSPLSSCLASVFYCSIKSQVYGNLVIKVWIDANLQELAPSIFKAMLPPQEPTYAKT